MKYTICYMSKAVAGLDAASLELIFASTQKKNVEKNITGILLYSLGNFFQVLEGDEKVIKALYDDYIREDPRHTDVFEIISRKSHQVFSDYSSIFKIIQTGNELDELKKYIAEHNISTTTDKYQRLLNTFIL